VKTLRGQSNRLAISLTRRFWLFCFVPFVLCNVAVAQIRSAPATAQPLSSAAAGSLPGDDDPQSTSRVAAPAEQIRAVLVKDPGLLVELERLVEKEELSKGQLVDDSDLTQQAIFDRLDDDVPFRAAATRLLQRYGYLLPNVNPDSEVGREQELVLKERARRIVQIEAQEDAQSLSPQRTSENSKEQTAADHCDSPDATDCKEPSVRRSPSNIASGARDQQSPNSSAPPPFNGVPELSGPPIIQTRLNGNSLSGFSGDPDSSQSLRMAGMSAPHDPTGMQPSPEQLQRYMSLLKNGSGSSDENFSAPNTETAKARGSGGGEDLPTSLLRAHDDWSRERSRVSQQGAIVHKPGPYSDVPSLFDLYVQVAAHNRPPERFGVDILTAGARDSGAVAMDLPVGPDYVVGPGDGLAIDLWGGVSQRIQRIVDSQGRISLPEYGPLLVSGRTLGDVQQTVQQLLRTQLRDISADVSLSCLRTIRIYVVGEVSNPGAYDVSSLSSPLNALVAAGGLTEHGSLRSIKHYRGKQLIEEVDAYDLLLRGVGSDQKRLQSGDSLLVPPVGPQVTIEGMVRRPAIYELNGDTSLEQALELAGGVLPAAALKHVEVERLVAHEKRIMFSLDLSETQNANDAESLRNFAIHDGDRIHIFPIAPYNQQAIYLQGHVLRPGRYSYRDGMTVADLITSYSDLLPEPAGAYAEIIRLNSPDYRPSVESFNLTAALSNPAQAPKLQPLDTVRVFSKYDFEPAPEVRVDGEVRAPGQYTTSGQARFRDAVYLAGGLTADASTDSAQIFRYTKDGAMKILNVNVSAALAGNDSSNVALEPHDTIVIHRSIAKVEPQAVYVKGDVENPGRYPLASNMCIEDLILAAGGLKPSADSQNAVLTHHAPQSSGTAEAQNLNVDLAAAMSGHPDHNQLLANGDVLTIRENSAWNDLGATVTIRGEVAHPGTYGIRPGESLDSVLAKAGGFTSQAYPYGTVLTRREVRDLEMKSRDELVARMKQEAVQLKALPENDADQKNLKLTAIAQTDATLTQLETHLPVGRVVLQGALDEKSFDRNAGQTPLRSGDVILVPKKPNYVVVEGQVFNGTAVGYVPGRSANWYLAQAGGLTELADKKATFVIRADGSVIAAKNNHNLWSGDPLDAVLMPGDVIVVPEKAPKIANRNWIPLMQSAQVATSVALAVAYLRP